MWPRILAASGHTSSSARTTSGAACDAAAKCSGVFPSSSTAAAASGQAMSSFRTVSIEAPLFAAKCSTVCLPDRSWIAPGYASTSASTTDDDAPLETAPWSGRLPSESFVDAAFGCAVSSAFMTLGGAALQHA
eukprot:5170963-Prymnesium_polylepis.1